MGSSTGKSDFTILQRMCYAIVYAAELFLSRDSMSLLKRLLPRDSSTRTYLSSLLAIHELFKTQILHVFIQAKLRRLRESTRNYLQNTTTFYLDCN